MAVRLSCYNLIIPRKIVDANCPEVVPWICRDYWMDEHLICTGAISGHRLLREIERWNRFGLDSSHFAVVEGGQTAMRRGPEEWLHQVAEFEWLEFDDHQRFARLVGVDPETDFLVGPEGIVNPPSDPPLRWGPRRCATIMLRARRFEELGYDEWVS